MNINTETKPEAVVELRRSRILRTTAIILFIACAAIWVLRDFVTQKALEGNPEWAWGAGFAQPLNTMRAEILLADGKRKAAKAAARKALLAKPGDIAAISVLALAADQEGNPEQAWRLMTLGGRWSWRDTPTQQWLYRDAYNTGQFEAAVIHGEALVSRRQLRNEIFPAFASLAAKPETRPLIVAALIRGKEWRSAFYAYLRKTPVGLQADMVRLLKDMSATTARPAPGDVAPLIEAMAVAGKGADSRSLWASYYKIPSSIVMAVVDGGFESSQTELALNGDESVFQWQFDRTAEIYITTEPSMRANKVLHIAAAGQNRASVVAQRLVLESGAWTLNFRIKSGLPDPASRLRIMVRCDGGSSQIIGVPPIIPSRVNQWHRIKMAIVVKPDCTSQWLRISTIGTISGDPIDAWVDDFSLLRV